MRIKYFPEVDKLDIDFVDDFPSVDNEEVAPGFLLRYDEDGRIVGIEIDSASHHVRLEQIESDPSLVVVMGDVKTVSTLAAEIGVGERSVQKTIQAMRSSGLDVGQQESPTHPIILSEADVLSIVQWREDHPRGRRSAKAATA